MLLKRWPNNRQRCNRSGSIPARDPAAATQLIVDRFIFIAHLLDVFHSSGTWKPADSIPLRFPISRRSIGSNRVDPFQLHRAFDNKRPNHFDDSDVFHLGQQLRRMSAIFNHPSPYPPAFGAPSHSAPPGPTRPHRDQPLWIDSSRFNPFKQQSNLSDRSLQANANATRLPRHSSDGAVATFWFIPPSPGSPGSPGSVESVGSPGLSCLPVSKRQSASRWEWQYSVGYRCRARFSTHPRDAPRRPPSGNLPFRFDCNTAATESYKLLPIISTVILLLLFHHHHHYYHLLFLLPLSYFFFSFTASLASLYSSFFSFSSSSSSSSSFFFP